MIETRAHRKKTKLSTPSTSDIPERYTQNTIKAELYRTKCISSDFASEIKLIRHKFKLAGYPIHFVNSVIREFTNSSK